MILDFEIDGVKYDYRKDAVGEDGVYKLDVPNKTYVSVDVVTAEIQAEVDRLVAIETSLEYKAERAEAYPPVGDQLDMIYKDNLNGTTTHKESVEAVKAKYPKP